MISQNFVWPRQRYFLNGEKIGLYWMLLGELLKAVEEVNRRPEQGHEGDEPRKEENCCVAGDVSPDLDQAQSAARGDDDQRGAHLHHACVLP